MEIIKRFALLVIGALGFVACADKVDNNPVSPSEVVEEVGFSMPMEDTRTTIAEVKYRIRVICMEDFEHVTNSDEYIGFLYGIISSDHDIETIFVDSILKHADFKMSDLPEFIDRLKDISKNYGMDFVVSVSAEKEEMVGVDFEGCEILN